MAFRRQLKRDNVRIGIVLKVLLVYLQQVSIIAEDVVDRFNLLLFSSKLID